MTRIARKLLIVVAVLLVSLRLADRSWALTQDGPQVLCAIEGVVSDDEGRPISGSRIEIVGLSESAVTSDEDGRFCLTGFPATDVQLLASADGYQPRTSDTFTVMSGQSRRVDILLTRAFSEVVTVTGLGAVGSAPPSASRGEIDAAQIAARALLRPGDVLGVVPGVVMTQHSSGGHAPIILLRGYNLDHGTDFATYVDDVPLNLPSHAHAQGYTDMNFIINEAIERIEFQKGPYAPQVGDFGTAGAANVIMKSEFTRPVFTYEFGPFGGHRALALGSMGTTERRVTYGIDVSHADGPNVVPDDFGRIKAMLRHSTGTLQRNRTTSAFVYKASWNATDGYPSRALARGDITRFGTLDSTDGGGAQHYQVSTRWRRADARAIRDVTVYGRLSDFDLYSNLTFWTRYPQQGDQIHQRERRLTTGLLANASAPRRIGTLTPMMLTTGLQLRHDIVALDAFNTVRRVPTVKFGEDGVAAPAHTVDALVHSSTAAGFADARHQWRRWLRTSGGLRLDVIRMDVRTRQAGTSGARVAAVVSPKANATFGPWLGMELFTNAGLSFHTNHAAGVMRPFDPSDPVVRTSGAELGAAGARRWLQWTAALWFIRSGSELIYVPEEGTTSPERPAQRTGIEASIIVRPTTWLTFDLDVASSSARYRTDPFGEGTRIPDALKGVVSTGVGMARGRWSANVRLRYLGERPLLPDGSVWSRPASIANVQMLLPVGRRVDLGVDVLNAFNRDYEDITYYFPTRLRDSGTGRLEPDPVDDYVTRPGEPRAARVRFIVRF